MENNQYNENHPPFPQYTIGEIMTLLKLDEKAVRNLISKADIEIDENINDPTERIAYDDFRKLWVSLANRREGRLLGALLVEESDSWWDKMIGKRK